MARQLRPVPDVAPRALGLVRVSKEREEMISPEIQRTAIEDYCARMGYELTGWMEGIDESGSERRSPWWRKLDQAIERVESGEFGVIVVWKWSRTARNRMRWAVALDRVDVAGGRLESATEPVDVSTSAGRLARGVLAEFNAFEAERIGEVWKEVQARRVKNGLPADGKARFGYRIEDGRCVPDEITGPVLASLYRRYATGESFISLAEWLNAEGIRPAAGWSKVSGDWRSNVVGRVLDSGFGAGFIQHGGQQLPGAHEPVIDRGLWERYLAARRLRRNMSERKTLESPYVLSGLVRCGWPVDGGECGSPMAGQLDKRADHPSFRCSAAQTSRRHRGGFVAMRHVEDAVLGWLREQAADVDAARDAQAAAKAHAVVRRSDARVLARQIQKLDKDLTNLTVHLAQGVIPAAAYASARDELLEQQQRLQDRLAAAQLEATAPNVAKISRRLLADWHQTQVAARRGTLRDLIGVVIVRPVGVAERYQVVPRWSPGYSD